MINTEKTRSMSGPNPLSKLRIVPALLLSLLIGCGTGGNTAGDASTGNDGGGNVSDLVVGTEPAFPALSFPSPVAMVQAPGDGSVWYLVERQGRILAFGNDATTLETSVFAAITGRVDSGSSEAGLLGMAFHPGFADNSQVFLCYTAPGTGAGVAFVSRVSRFQLLPDGSGLDPDSEEVLLSVDQPFPNHNGGHLAFGPDGFLYVGLGDGGSGGDPQGHAQNTNTLLGAILRIDVDGGVPYAVPPGNPFVQGGGRPEIFAWGLRNPWRWSFDRASGELWCGDVGQREWEEVDVIRAGGNYGWNLREGAHCFGPEPCAGSGLTDPVAEYSHAEGCSVTGGYVYRGAAIPGLDGTYIYGDFCSGTVWGLPAAGGGPVVLIESSLRISSFAEGIDGELYILDYGTGTVHRIVELAPEPASVE